MGRGNRGAFFIRSGAIPVWAPGPCLSAQKPTTPGGRLRAIGAVAAGTGWANIVQGLIFGTFPWICQSLLDRVLGGGRLFCGTGKKRAQGGKYLQANSRRRLARGFDPRAS